MSTIRDRTYRLDPTGSPSWHIVSRLAGGRVRVESDTLIGADGQPANLTLPEAWLIAADDDPRTVVDAAAAGEMVPFSPGSSPAAPIDAPATPSGAVEHRGTVAESRDSATVPTARRTDPATSHEAAASITVQRMRADHHLVLAALHDHGPMTDFALASRVSSALGRIVKQTSIGVRRKELVTLGLVRNSGRRAPSDTGKASIVWTLTAAGYAELGGAA